MNLDPRTVLFLTCLSALLTGLAMFVAARAYAEHVPGMRHWAWACLAQGLAWPLAALRGHLPDFLSVVVSNTLLPVSLALQLDALLRFQGTERRPQSAEGTEGNPQETKDASRETEGVSQPPSGRWLARVLPFAPAAAVFVLFLHFTYADPDLAARIVVISLGTAPLLLACAVILLRGRTPPSQVATALGFLACGGACLVRAALVLAGGQVPRSFLGPGPLQTVAFLWVFLAGLVIPLGYVLMCGGRFNAALRRLAVLDSVTGSLNRSAIDLLARKELGRALRTDTPLSLLMLDVDHFKSVNDTHGHLVGDGVLRELVGTVGGHLRPYDLIGRFGGEEFLVVLPDTAAADAAQIAERMRVLVEQSRPEVEEHQPEEHQPEEHQPEEHQPEGYATRDGQLRPGRGLSLARDDRGALRYTVSIGVATLGAGESDYHSLLRRADAALYAAKGQGRNRVASAPPFSPPPPEPASA